MKSLWLRMTMKLPEPLRASEIGIYQDNFDQAVRFTKSCGFDLRHTPLLGGDVLDAQGNFATNALTSAGINDASKSALQCLKWSHYLAPYFANTLGCKVWPTVGQIWKDDSKIFGPSWRDLRRWAANGVQQQDFEGRQGMNLHAWLTLETGEIIDVSFLNTLAHVNPEAYGPFKGAVSWGRDPGVLNNHRYFPMAVGQEYIEQVSARSMIPLLATNLNELNTPFVALVITPNLK